MLSFLIAAQHQQGMLAASSSVKHEIKILRSVETGLTLIMPERKIILFQVGAESRYALLRSPEVFHYR
jgi:hypothetical protein